MATITMSLRVTAPERAPAHVSIGRRHFVIGRPIEFDDASPHVAALEYALGAVGGEVVNGLREFARRPIARGCKPMNTREIAHAKVAAMVGAARDLRGRS